MKILDYWKDSLDSAKFILRAEKISALLIEADVVDTIICVNWSYSLSHEAI